MNSHVSSCKPLLSLSVRCAWSRPTSPVVSCTNTARIGANELLRMLVTKRCVVAKPTSPGSWRPFALRTPISPLYCPPTGSSTRPARSTSLGTSSLFYSHVIIYDYILLAKFALPDLIHFVNINS